MSGNIVKGVDYGMGYEPTETWEPGIQYFSKPGNIWRMGYSENQEELNGYIRLGDIHRRRLRIFKNSKAIPLEPGEVVLEGVKYLCRDGSIEILEKNEGPHNFSYPMRGVNQGYTFNLQGQVVAGQMTDYDIVGRFPEQSPRSPEDKVKGAENFIEVPAESFEINPRTNSLMLSLDEAVKIASHPSVVKKIEEKEKWEKGDWFVYQGNFYFCDNVIGFHLVAKGIMFHRDLVKKVEDQRFVAILNERSGRR